MSTAVLEWLFCHHLLDIFLMQEWWKQKREALSQHFDIFMSIPTLHCIVANNWRLTYLLQWKNFVRSRWLYSGCYTGLKRCSSQRALPKPRRCNIYSWGPYHTPSRVLYSWRSYNNPSCGPCESLSAQLLDLTTIRQHHCHNSTRGLTRTPQLLQAWQHPIQWQGLTKPPPILPKLTNWGGKKQKKTITQK